MSNPILRVPVSGLNVISATRLAGAGGGQSASCRGALLILPCAAPSLPVSPAVDPLPQLSPDQRPRGCLLPRGRPITIRASLFCCTASVWLDRPATDRRQSSARPRGVISQSKCGVHRITPYRVVLSLARPCCVPVIGVRQPGLPRHRQPVSGALKSLLDVGVPGAGDMSGQATSPALPPDALQLGLAAHFLTETTRTRRGLLRTARRNEAVLLVVAGWALELAGTIKAVSAARPEPAASRSGRDEIQPRNTHNTIDALTAPDEAGWLPLSL